MTNILNRTVLLLMALLSLLPLAHAQDIPLISTIKYKKVETKTYRFRLYLTDKKDNSYSLRRPEEFLSKKALDRRKRLGVKVDIYDLPLSSKYLKTLRQCPGVSIHNQSKWNNTVVVEMADSSYVSHLKELPFVSSARCVWVSPDSVIVPSGMLRQDFVTNKRDTTFADRYGYGATQVRMLSADKLHEAGYTGRGVTVGVIDGGFFNADLLTGIDQKHILGTRNFVRPKKSVYEELDHGMMVLSCMAANVPNYLVGTAPDADYYLIQSEDGESEQLVEEDNWCAALEYADSLGCDLVTSSLGYYHFDYSYMNHSYKEQDGRTALNSISASLAASRGLLVLNSAGNSGMGAWKKIGFPADASHILAIGAINDQHVNTFFSSIGNTEDGRTKPDLMALGQNSRVFDDDGTVCEVNGTSFSCPITAGAVACLLQMFPTKKPDDVIRSLQQTADNADTPNNIMGYGIPNVAKAAEYLKTGKK